MASAAACSRCVVTLISSAVATGSAAPSPAMTTPSLFQVGADIARRLRPGGLWASRGPPASHKLRHKPNPNLCHCRSAYCCLRHSLREEMSRLAIFELPRWPLWPARLFLGSLLHMHRHNGDRVVNNNAMRH